jgi:carboxylesterase type B
LNIFWFLSLVCSILPFFLYFNFHGESFKMKQSKTGNVFVLFILCYVSTVNGKAVARTKCGLIIGKSTNNVNSFEGIPYTEPRTGINRWTPPTSNECTITGTFDASNGPGPSCYQKPREGVIMSEDCLHLNIYAPTTTKKKLLPVMLYLHGGSLVEGSSTAIQAGYGGPITLANRSNSSIISVSMNYRLGVLGFLALDVLKRNCVGRNRTTSGNYGLLDVLEGLRWIQRNIKSFGGDPNKVTVYGQSSGGSLVFALMISPYSNNLFQRAISMSGSPRLNSTLSEAMNYWHPQVVDNTICNISRTASCLRTLKPSMLVEAQPENWDPSDGWSSKVFWDSYQYAPLLIIDGDVLPTDYRLPSSSYNKSRTKRTTPLDNHVPLIIGVTREEIDFAPGNDVRNMTHNYNIAKLFNKALMNSTNGTKITRSIFSKKVLLSYGLTVNTSSKLIPVQGKNAPPELIFSDFISDATMLCGTYVLADAWSSVSDNIYMYTVSQRPGKPFCALSSFQKENAYCPIYSFHAIDMFAMYDWLPTYLTPNHVKLYNKTNIDVQFTNLVRKRLVDEFAWDGEIKTWKRYNSKGNELGRNVEVLNIRDERTLKGWREAQCKLFLNHGYYETKVWIN